MSYLLFFGAGASQPFNIPTMQEMVTEFEKILTTKNMTEKNLYSKIKELQQKGYGYSKVDIESVFSVIEGIASGLKPNNMGHLPYYYISSNNINKDFSIQEVESAKKLKVELEEFIKNKCKSELNNTQKNKIYSQSYDALLTNIPGTKTGFTGEVHYPTDWIAYTTNYDRVFEDFCADFFTLIDHFVPEGSSKHHIFDIGKSVQGQNLSFAKLHGSLDWLREKSGKIMKIESTAFTRHQIEGEAMVFPIQQKDLYLHPWITLFQDFKYGLRTSGIWIVIGYAFNDEFILEIFKEALTKDKKLILIDPRAEELLPKFSEKLRENIIALPIKFGNEFFPMQIKDFFDGVKTLEVRIKTHSPYFAFESSLPIASIFHEKSNRGNAFTLKGKIINYEFPDAISHEYVDEQKFLLKIFYDPQKDKDLELKFIAKAEHDTEMYVDLYGKQIIYKKSRTNHDGEKYVSESIKMMKYQLFIKT